jgi:RHS repeat-associated protein
MRRVGAISLLSFAVMALTCLPAVGQSCGAWQSVSSWQGTVTLSGSGSGPDNEGAYTWTVNHAVQNQLALAPSTTSACTWVGGNTATDSENTGSFNDQGVSSESCGGGANTMSLVGSQFDVDGLTLTIDTASNTYTLSPSPEIGGTLTTICGSQKTTNSIILFAGPFTSSCAPASVTFSLPGPSIGVLQPPAATFTDTADCEVDGGIPGIKFTLTFTLTPGSATSNNNVDNQCSQSGGSSIGCQNQSLGEDVPVVGTGFFLHYESDRAPGRNGANAVASADAAMLGGWTLNVHHAYDPASNTLFLGDGSQRSAWQLGTPVAYNGNKLLTSGDGTEVYVFSGTTGRHVQTLQPMTGAIKYKFAYDGAGNLSSVTDASNNVTTIDRNASEHPAAIVSPYSQRTTLDVDSNGFLSLITNPAGDKQDFTNSAGDLLTARTDANGDSYSYKYDSQGALTLDSDPVGGSTSLTRSTTGSGYSVASTTAMGRTSTFSVRANQTRQELTNVWPNKLAADGSDIQQTGTLQEVETLPDGTTNTRTLGPDPRFGLQVPVLTSATLQKGSLTESRSGSRTADFTTNKPFSLVTQTDKTAVNGRTYTSAFTASTRTYVGTSPVGRKTTRVLDSLERLGSLQVGTLTATQYAYDSRGRLETITQGARKTSFTYDTDGFLASITDPLKLTTSFTHDSAGRMLTTTLADGRIISYTYDANGNRTSVTPPGKSAHDFAYSEVNLATSYTPPTVSGTGLTTYAYNTDRQIETITRPDERVIRYGYDSAGRLSSIATPTETIDYSYSSTTGNLDSASLTSGEALAYTYNGPLLTSTKWTGTIDGTVGYAYNDNFWTTSETINAANDIAFSYDNDGLVTKAGAMTVVNNSNGLITGTTLDSATDTRTYDSFGELTGVTASYSGSPVYAVTYTRDADGRVASKSETIGDKTNSYAYHYDLAGRLTGVSENGATISSYSYDTNSNRVKAVTSAGSVTATYDAQDRLLTYGSVSFTYTANGELATQTVGSAKTTYTYDVLGNLIAVTLPSGKAITYVVDAQNRRIGKKVAGALTQGFLYDQNNRIVAQLNASNAIASQFVYGTGNTPDYMIAGGATYRIFSDQLGSPRLVVNASTGAIAEQITYDEFGNVTSDTNPGFQPFGFVGGLYDQDTKLVRFGARDFNPATGRWTAKDPILFVGGSANLYGYVLEDPINGADPSGKGLGDWIVTTLTSMGIDLGSAAAQGQPVDPTIGLDAIPAPAGSEIPAAQFALQPDNALNICTTIQAWIQHLTFTGGMSAQGQEVLTGP